jgi:peptidoglycan hydrolase-like protein with peptidoglycan-binding domain
VSSQVEKVLALAEGEVGYHEGFANGHWNNKEKYAGEVPGLAWADYQAWCATFVSWLAYKAGVSDLFPRTASCLTGVNWFKQRGRFSAYPAIGAQVFYGKNGGTHTGIVYDYDADFIYTIEGNTNADGSAEGDGVYKKKRLRRSDNTYGYGYPKYAEGIKSADPAFKNEAPKAEAKPAPSKPAPAKPKPAPAKSTIVALNKAVKPGATHAQVKELQQLLVKAGYGPIKGAYTAYYGAETQKAVARFHNKNPQFKSAGKSYDPAIGASGFKHLQQEAGRK